MVEHLDALITSGKTQATWIRSQRCRAVRRRRGPSRAGAVRGVAVSSGSEGARLDALAVKCRSRPAVLVADPEEAWRLGGHVAGASGGGQCLSGHRGGWALCAVWGGSAPCLPPLRHPLRGDGEVEALELQVDVAGETVWMQEMLRPTLNSVPVSGRSPDWFYS